MYEFTEDCMIHIDNIDEEHRKLFQMLNEAFALVKETDNACLLYTSPSPRDSTSSRMPSSA